MIKHLWTVLSDTFAASGDSSDQQQLAIEAAGLCCSVGYHLAAASCAIRANMDHFSESDFVTAQRHPVRVARLPDDIYGDERLQRWVELVLLDVAQHLPDAGDLFDPRKTAVVVLAPDAIRAHSDAEATAELVSAALDAVMARLAPHAAGATLQMDVLAQGRAGLASALMRSSQVLRRGQQDQVLLIGVDTYLTAADIGTLLAQERLIVPGNSDGFMPGEAAAAVLLRRAQGGDAPCIRGCAMADEPGRPDGSVPSRAQGLTEAVRQACERARLPVSALDFRMSDQNGEQFFSREAATGFARVMHGLHDPELFTLADKIGETGAAAGVAMLAWLWDAWAYDDGPPATGVLHLANDDGRRCAVVVQATGA